jgi:NAD(P)-dependent dehydrogenase (short-subunit alcohol dehydrogenase family)
MGQVSGKVAIVTGAASGIGAACATTLAREGARVMLTDIDETGLAAGVGRITAAGGEAATLRQDVTDEAHWPEVIAATETRFGRLDIMVANAGIGIMVPVWEMSLSDWRRQTAINLDGVFLSVKHCIPAMRRAGGGSFVIMSSVAGLRGAAGLAGYCATKGGVRFFAKAVALECAAAGDRIRVNSVHPGIIATPIWDKIPAGGLSPERRNAGFDPEAMSQASVPLRRAGQAEDIANGVLYLASDASSYVTGSEIVIDGGMLSGSMPRPT